MAIMPRQRSQVDLLRQFIAQKLYQSRRASELRLINRWDKQRSEINERLAEFEARLEGLAVGQDEVERRLERLEDSIDGIISGYNQMTAVVLEHFDELAKERLEERKALGVHERTIRKLEKRLDAAHQLAVEPVRRKTPWKQTPRQLPARARRSQDSE